MSCLFNYNLPPSFRNKTVSRSELLVIGYAYYIECRLKICISVAHIFLTKSKILSMLGTGYLLKIAKINSSEKNQSVLIAKISCSKTQKIANPQKFRATL